MSKDWVYFTKSEQQVLMGMYELQKRRGWYSFEDIKDKACVTTDEALRGMLTKFYKYKMLQKKVHPHNLRKRLYSMTIDTLMFANMLVYFDEINRGGKK